MRRIYLDHAAATPLRPEVRAVMEPHLEGLVGNPSSVHRWGRNARRELDRARERVGELLDVASTGVRFVRGGTEAINLAVLGRSDWARTRGVAGGVLYRSALEHSAVRESMAAAAVGSWESLVIAVDPDGSLTLPSLDPLEGSGVLVAVQWVNHETGLILRIADAAVWARRSGLPLHVDAVQALGVPDGLPGDFPEAMFSVSGHKLGGPRSTGVLILPDSIELSPRLFGGGQEEGIRPGTEDVAGAVGFARALDAVLSSRTEEAERLTELRERLESGLRQAVPALRVHGGAGRRAPHILNVGFEGVPRDILPGALDLEGVGASAGSACRSGSTALSPTLEALYGEAATTVAPLRFSLGWTSTADEIDEALVRIPPVVERVAALGVGASRP